MTAGRMVAMLVLTAAMAGASGCGRKGDLDTPYAASVQARKDAEKAKQDPLPPEPVKPATDKPFILDRLIQ